jgi:hypothetical protein
MINIHAVDIVEQNALLLSGGQPPVALLSLVNGRALAPSVLGRVVILVPLAVIVQQVLVGPQQERTGAAGGVENPQLTDLPGCFSINEPADGLLNNVVYNVRGSVVDTARLPDLRLLLHLGPTA